MKQRDSNALSRPRLNALAAGIALGMACGQAALANPTGPAVAHGAASFARPDASTLNVTNSPNTVINWQGFSIGAHETTRFIQQSASSRVLNRVTGGNVSRLMGRLLSNGRVFLINPSGIVFGPDSVIDTAGFLASSLNISDRDFLEGRFHFDGGPGAGAIDNQGYIRTGPDGEIILIAPEIENSGIIEAEGGRLVLAAGRRVTLTSLDEEGITFEVQAPEDTVVNLGELLAHHGSAEVFAGVIENKGTISADGVEVDARGRVVLTSSHATRLDAGSTVSARGGDVAVTVKGPTQATPEAGFLALEGRVSADGAVGGRVDIAADRILAAGTVSADGATAGGRVAITAGERILATADSRVSASGGTGGGGNVKLHGGDSLFTSGTVAATGEAGGRIELTGGEVKLAGARVDASGPRGGGDIRVGGGRAGGEGVATAADTWVNYTTVLEADAHTDGDGGSIVVWGDAYSNFAGRASARGGSGGGDGGFVEISSKEVFDATGTVDVLAPAGENGTLLLDPKDFAIGSGFGTGATAGVGILSLVDPNPGAGDNFGSSVSTAFESSSGVLWVMNPNDDLAGTDSGAVYAFNSSTGALAGAVVGASAGDRVGDNSVASVTGSNFLLYLRVPNFNGGQGLVTTLDPANPPTGVLGTANSLVGVGFPTISTFGNDVLYIANSTASVGGNANAGFLTFYDATSPFTGLVGPANALVGANAGDRVGSSFPSSVSGTNRRLVRIPDFDGGRGAITTVDPFNFVPGTVSTTNSLVGAGNVTVNTFGLGGGLVIVRDQTFDPTGGSQANTGYLTIYDINNPTTGTVGPGNALIGENAGDRLGSDIPRSVSGGSNWFLEIPSYSGGTGAVTALDPFNFAPGTFDPANALVGTANAAFDTSTTGGNVLLWSSNATVAGQTGFVTVYNVDSPANGTLGAGNALIGTGAASVDTFTLGSSSGLVIVRNQAFDPTGGSQPNTGFLTVYDVTAPSTGTVDATKAIVGGSAGDRVGDNNLQTVSGSSRTVLEIPNFGGVGAVITVDPQAFNPRTVTAANSFTGTGNVTLDAFTLGGGLVVVRNPAYDPGNAANLGFLSVYDVNAPITNQAVGTGNSLLGSAAGDQVGSNTLEFVSGGTDWLLKVPGFNGNQGAVTTVNPFSFGGGTVTAANSFTGVGSVNSQNFIGGGDVLLYNGAVTVNGNANAGFVTTFNVDAPLVNQGVSVTNSLVGASAGDQLGGLAPTNVSGTKWLVRTLDYDNGAAANAGAVLLYDTASPITGLLGPANALVGGATGDGVGGAFDTFSTGVLVRSQFADIGGNADAGAATFLPFAGPAVVGAIGGATGLANSLVGANANDRVGSTNTTFVSGSSKVILQMPLFNAGQGAVTTIDPANFQSGTVSTANSLVGTAGMSVNTFSVGSGIVQMSNAGFDLGANANVGFFTYYDVDNPFTGTVGPTTALVGGNAGDQVGSTPTSISGSSKRLLQVPNFNGGQGAVKAVDPFNFSPGTLTAGNSFTGVGNTFNTVVSLGSGNFLLAGASADVGGVDRGFVSRLNIDSLGGGAVSAANSLVGANDNDRVGSNGINGVSGSNRRLVNIPNFNGGQGAITTIDPANFAPGVVSSSNSLVGTQNPSIDTFVGAGNVVLRNPNADVGGLTNNGYATVYNVGAPLTGVVSASNSLVGVFPGDAIGSGGRIFLSTGNVLVRSPLADASVSLVDAGRLDILDLAGITGGTGGLTFASDPNAVVNAGAGTLSALLASGTNLTLQANNDIMVMLGAPINGATVGTTGGNLSLQAGRKLVVNDDITVDGNLELAAGLGQIPGTGVQTAFTEAGSGDLVINNATVSGRNLFLSGANITIDPSTVSSEQDLFVLATGNFSLLDDSELSAPAGDLGILARGNILVQDSVIKARRVLALGNNVGVRGAPGASPDPSSDYGLIEGYDLVAVAAVGANASGITREVLSGDITAADVLTRLGSLPLAGGTLALEAGTTPHADALIVSGQGLGPAIIGFADCVGCLPPIVQDPFLNDLNEAGIWAEPITFVPIEGTPLNVANELLRLLAGSSETLSALIGEEEEEEDDEGDGEDLDDDLDGDDEGEQELQECR